MLKALMWMGGVIRINPALLVGNSLDVPLTLVMETNMFTIAED